ncbi:hypothetical protein ELI00_37545 [Rhizobium ruizarguesonis]|nr:hypothetical protein ELI00_37545 [Rhizobium ruizarguesonis]
MITEMISTASSRSLGIADTVLAAKLRDRRARLMLFQNADNLFVCETVALHSLVHIVGIKAITVPQSLGRSWCLFFTGL